MTAARRELEEEMSLNESPSKKEGKFGPRLHRCLASPRLNESPSKKEGK